MSSEGGGHRYEAHTASPLEAYLADLVRDFLRRDGLEVLRGLVQQELAAGAGAEAEWLSQPAAARLAGVTPQTVRAWQADHLLTRGRHGRVNAAELRRFLAAGGGKPAEPAIPELRQERARRAAQDVLQRFGRPR